MVTAEQYKEPYFSLKDRIERKGMTQKEIAEKIGMDRAVFNVKINRTNGRDFSLSEAERIAQILEMKIDDFF